MIDLFIEPTVSTPLVKISTAMSSVQISGKSSPQNALGFYYPIKDKIEHLFAGKSSLAISFAFRYFNTSSSKCLFDLMKTLKKINQSGTEVLVKWHYEDGDEDMLETGEDFSDLIGLNFDFVSVEEINSSFTIA